jgi:MFS family permease
MAALLVALAAATAVAAAARSTWSPCGLSMLSSITPMGERARRYTYGGTAAWFVAGAVLGGATLGLGAAGLAALVGALDLDPRAALAVAGVLALVGAASDGRVAGFRLPGHTRQVNEVWLDRYRSWVYGAGFGWQIGVGLSTFIVTAAVYLLVALAALTGDPFVAFLLCTGFGFLRGLAVLLSRTATSSERLQALHRRFDELSAPSWRLTIAAQLAIAVVALAATASPVATIVLAIAGSVVGQVHLGSRLRRQSRPA